MSAPGGGNGAGAAVTAGAQSTSFLSKAEAFGSGVYDGAVKPLVDTIRHPINALEGIGHAIAHPIDTAGALAHAVKDGGAKALSGDPYAIGMALGTVGSLVVPGAGEAEAAEDAVRVGQVGKLAEASEVAKAADVADAAKAAELEQAPKAADGGNAAARDLDALRRQYQDEIKASSTFKPLGLSDTEIDQYLQTENGEKYLDELSKADPNATPTRIFERASQQLGSGREIPTAHDGFSEPLIKLVPQGETVTSYSPFFTTASELEKALSSGRPLGDSFGLPLASQADTYDIFQIAPPSEGGTVFSSTIAPTSELSGQFTTQGGAMQYLLPNRAGWSPPVKIGTILNVPK